MNWYLTKIIYRIVCGDGMHSPQYEEQLRLVTAPGKLEAVNKARQIGKQEEETFYNDKQQLVRWEFINVIDVYPFNKLIDGAAVFSRVTEEESAELYEYIIHKKSENIFSNQVPELLDQD